jgi:exonuclease 3'-5' domain-containing protein 1
MATVQNYSVVDAIPALSSLLYSLRHLPTDPPSLFFDIEGVNLGRHGSMSLVSLYVAPQSTTYIIDVHILGAEAFQVVDTNNNSLKDILESADIPKVFFDIRNDSDALYSLYGICVNGIIDIQLLELATRRSSKGYVAGLVKCIEKDSTASAATKKAWHRTKDSVGRLYDPQRGGRYEVFNERPLMTEILQYCKQDVELLPTLCDVYSSTLREPSNGPWRALIREATRKRIQLSQSAGYDGQAKSKVHGPWDTDEIERKIDDWNDDVMMWGVNGGDTLDENDHWVNSRDAQASKSSVFTLLSRF